MLMTVTTILWLTTLFSVISCNDFVLKLSENNSHLSYPEKCINFTRECQENEHYLCGEDVSGTYLIGLCHKISSCQPGNTIGFEVTSKRELKVVSKCIPCKDGFFEPISTTSSDMEFLTGCRYKHKAADDISPHSVLFMAGAKSLPNIWYCDSNKGFADRNGNLFCTELSAECECVTTTCPNPLELLPDGSCQRPCIKKRSPENSFRCNVLNGTEIRSNTTRSAIDSTAEKSTKDLILVITTAVICAVVICVFITGVLAVTWHRRLKRRHMNLGTRSAVSIPKHGKKHSGVEKLEPFIKKETSDGIKTYKKVRSYARDRDLNRKDEKDKKVRSYARDRDLDRKDEKECRVQYEANQRRPLHADDLKRNSDYASCYAKDLGAIEKTLERGISDRTSSTHCPPGAVQVYLPRPDDYEKSDELSVKNFCKYHERKIATEVINLLPCTNANGVVNVTEDDNGKKIPEDFVTHAEFDITSSTLKNMLFEAINNGDVTEVRHVLSSDACISDTILQNCIQLSIERKCRELLSTFLNHACSVLQQRDSKIIEVWSAYQKDHEWEPLFVVLSADSYKGEYSSFLGLNLYKRKRSYISREAAAVLRCQKVKDNPLHLAEYDRLSSLYHKEDLFTKHSNITVISASPCRSKKLGQEIFVETCIVIHCLVKGFIPFDEEPFPEQLSGVPVDVREGYFTFGGKSDKPKKRNSDPFYRSNNRVHKSTSLSETKLCHTMTPKDSTGTILPEIERSQSESALYIFDPCRLLSHNSRLLSHYSNMRATGNICENEENIENSSQHPKAKAEGLSTCIKVCDNLHVQTDYFTGVATNISSCTSAVSDSSFLSHPSEIKNPCTSYLKTHQSDTASNNPDAAQKQSNNMDWTESYCDNQKTVPLNSMSRVKKSDDFKRKKGIACFHSGRCLSESSVNLPDDFFARSSYTTCPTEFNLKSSQTEQLLNRHLSSRPNFTNKIRAEKDDIRKMACNNSHCYFEEANESEESKDRDTLFLEKSKSCLEDDKTLQKRSTNKSSASTITYDKMSHVSVADGDGPLEFNEILLMGTGIGLSGSSLRGTLGGFVHHEDGTICFLTCAHVIGHESGIADENMDKLVCQPADADIQPKRRFKPQNADPQTQRQLKRTVCGHVYKEVFDPGNGAYVSVDAALVAIEKRQPNRADFRWVRDDQLIESGFDPSSPPQFMKGNILTYENLKKQENGFKDVFKIGAETGLSKGSIVMVGTDVRKLNKKKITLTTPNDKPVTFYRQIEVSPDEGVSFFDLGDSGSLVFMQFGSELYCIGMAIGVTHPQRTCIVTPIESVFEKLGLPEDTKFIDFTDNIE